MGEKTQRSGRKSRKPWWEESDLHEVELSNEEGHWICTDAHADVNNEFAIIGPAADEDTALLQLLFKTVRSLQISVSVTLIIATVLVIAAPSATALFTRDEEVIYYGVLFLRMNTYFLLFNTVNHVLAGALRGRGDSKAPMICMLSCFVVIRQIYLFVGSRISYTPYVVGFGYPVGWMTCCAAELIYFFRMLKKKVGQNQ